MRKIASFTVLNNEVDVIESFVRYNMVYLDKMVIIDNGCTDGTIDILRLLQKEGYDIEIFDESLIDFEQYQIMNKYLRLVAEKYAPDIIVPLDADEFLMSDEMRVRDVLESISLDYVHWVQWRTFIMTEKDGQSGFVCKDMQYSYLHKDGKVIIPTNLIQRYAVILSVGQHGVVGDIGLETKECEVLQLAHYPNRSIEQVKAKSLCHSIRYVNYLNRRNEESIHRNVFARQCIVHLDATNAWLGDFVMHRMDEKHSNVTEVEYHPINLTLELKASLKMEYADRANVNTFLNLYELAKIMAIKAYNLQIEKEFSREAMTIIVYGTGERARNLFLGFPCRLVNVRAYINSNPEVELSMFERRLVITPRILKFFRYDKVLISSSLYYDEMKDNLLEVGVPEGKIGGAEILLEESIKKLS